jgi:ribokinase
MATQPHIAVVGSANVDLTTFTDRFPRPGETIFGRSFHLGFGGKGANQVVAARLCGARVSMIARVGDDLFGKATVDNFTARGIDAALVRITPGVSSGVAPIFVGSDGQNRILVVKGANDRLLPADIDAAAPVLRAGRCDRSAVGDPARDRLLHAPLRPRQRGPRHSQSGARPAAR